MPSKGMYRCQKCGAIYRPLEAAARHHLCCGMSLERIPVQSPPWRLFGATQPPVSPGRPPISREQPPSTTSPSSATLGPPPLSPQRLPAPNGLRSPTVSPDTRDATGAIAGHSVIEIIPPREHHIDEAGAERMFASFGNDQPVSVEIGGDGNGVKFLLRAQTPVASRVQQQLQATYDQARFRPVPPAEDPARMDGLACATAKLALRKPCFLPLLTFRDGDFLVGDPLRGLLGVFSNLRDSERLLSQLIITPAPRSWADPYTGYLHPPGTASGSVEPLTMQVALRQFVSVMTVMAALALSLWALLAFLLHRWVEFVIATPLAGFAIVAVGYLFTLALERSNLNPELIQRKIQSAAYDVSFRLVAFAPTAERADQLLRQLALAYRQYDLANGNALIGRRERFDPRVLEPERTPWWKEFLGSVNRLNVAELAALWHLPIDKDVPLVERNQTKRLLPLPQMVREGIFIGQSEHQGRTIDVHLDRDAFWHHAFMVAKTQKGKSNLMAHLAVAAMRHAERPAVVVIDPHGDLVRSLLPRVPRERVSDVVYVDFSEKREVIGLNLLDMRQGRDADRIVSNIVHVGELIWKDYWGPRMESALRYAVRTLLAVNAKLVERGERQFTIAHIPPLFELENFRHRLLAEFVSEEEILEWWSTYYERLYESLRIDVINPVLTKLHRLTAHAVVRAVVGQSDSTINFREILDQRRILLVNTATGVIGPDAGALLGAVIVDFVNFAVREQIAIPDPAARGRAVVVVDEFQTILGVDYPGLLAELQKMGASFILATQALGQLNAISPELRDAIFSNIASLFVFQTSAEDADFLRHELDNAVTATDIINLPDYTTYLRTQRGHERLPVMSLQIAPPEVGEPETAEQILRYMHRFTRPLNLAEMEQRSFKAKWYGREMELLRKRMISESKEKQPKHRGKNDPPDKPQSKDRDSESRKSDQDLRRGAALDLGNPRSHAEAAQSPPEFGIVNEEPAGPSMGTADEPRATDEHQDEPPESRRGRAEGNDEEKDRNGQKPHHKLGFNP